MIAYLDTGTLVKLYVDEPSSAQAAALVEKHALRGFDSLHLASALFLRNRIPTGQVVFSSSDKKLNEAAEKEGFQGSSIPKS